MDRYGRVRDKCIRKSSIDYHGHRFIWEYDDPKWRDINNPVALFSGETPPQWENVSIGLYSWYFTTRAYIHEPNIFSLNRRESSPLWTTNYSVYDSGLIMMMNFDNIKEIGENTTTIKDLSLYNNRGERYGNNIVLGYTWSAQRWGAARFNVGWAANSYIWGKIPLIRNNIISISLRFKHNMTSDGALFRENWETNNNGLFIRIEPGNNRIRAYLTNASQL